MGRAIGSRYELDDEIGRGAFGAVWRGRVRSTGEPVAIKVLLEEFAADADVVTRFLRERAALVGLNHRSLVRLRDLVVEGDILALVMQLVEGPDLKKYLATRQRLEPVEAGLLVAEVAEAMAVAHSAGIVHRDIKPANVLLEQVDGGLRPLLTDFGIARIADAPSVTRTHQVVGTPYYLAPEVVAGKKATPAADVYAAGIMLYELITGHPTFRGPDAVSVFRQHMNTVPERPAEIPTRLWPVIAAALVKEPEARPSALVLAAQLRAAVGRSVSGPDGEITHQLPVEGRYGTLRLPPIGASGHAAVPPAGNGTGPASGQAGGSSTPASPVPQSSPAVAGAIANVAAAAPLPVRPTRPVDGKVAGWDAPSDPDAIGAGITRRVNSANTPTVPVQQPAQPAMPPQMQRQLDQLHRQQQLAAQQAAEAQQNQRERLAAYPPQPQFGQQGYQQPGPGYQQQQPGPGQQYPPQFQASAAAPPRAVAYTPNQPPVMPQQNRSPQNREPQNREPQNRPPQNRPQPQREQPQVIVQKKVVKRRSLHLGCLIKLAILGAIAFGIYTGVNWVTYQINHFDINQWVTQQWHAILANINKKR